MESLAKQAIIFGMAAKHQESKLSKQMELGSFLEAITCEDAKFWIPAIAEEYDSLVRNGTWTLFQLPTDRKAIQGKWVMKFKPGFKTTPPRYKARRHQGLFRSLWPWLQGNLPTCSEEFLAHSHQTAILYGTLDEEIYMEQPEGFVNPGKEQKVCRLVKIIYDINRHPASGTSNSTSWSFNLDSLEARLTLVFTTAIYVKGMQMKK